MTNDSKTQETVAQIENIRTLATDSEKIDALISVVRDLFSNLVTMNDYLNKTIEQASVISNTMNTAVEHIIDGFDKADKD